MIEKQKGSEEAMIISIDGRIDAEMIKTVEEIPDVLFS